MNYKDFSEQLTKEIRKRIDPQAQIRVSRIQRMNVPPTDGMTILLPGENTAPAIYLDSFYQDHLNGTDLSTIVDNILAFHAENQIASSCDLSFYMNFDQASRRIVCRVVNYEKNRALLGKVPYHRFLDLAIVYYYQLESRAFGNSSILVQNTHTALWGISKDDLHNLAIQNTRSLFPFRISTLRQLLSEMASEVDVLPFSPTEEEPPSMYILTNEEMSYGAVNIIFDDLLGAVSAKLGGDFYVLPSSIHECLILPICEWNDTEPERLREIVSDINTTFISAEEVLGDNVYRYDHASGKLLLATC